MKAPLPRLYALNALRFMEVIKSVTCLHEMGFIKNFNQVRLMELISYKYKFIWVSFAMGSES